MPPLLVEIRQQEATVQPVISMSFSVMAGHSPSKDGRSSERPMPGHPRGSACGWPKGFADRAPTGCETAVRLDDVDGRDKPWDKPCHDVRGSYVESPFHPSAPVDGRNRTHNGA